MFHSNSKYTCRIAMIIQLNPTGMARNTCTLRKYFLLNSVAPLRCNVLYTYMLFRIYAYML